MSTQRVEVNPDDNSQTLEQSAEQLQKDGLTLTENGTVSATESTTSVSEPDTNIQSSEDRPEWLPEKFQSAEDLAKAYSELEKKLSNPQEQQATEEQPTKEEVEQQTGITLDKYYDEWVEKGELGEESYTELEKAGLPKELVDGYIEGQKALADQQVGRMYDAVGGEDNYKNLMDWASTNLTEAEQTAFNDTIDNGSQTQMEFALQGLMAKAGMTSETSNQLFQGETNVVDNDVFTSVAQVTEAMSNPKYDSDPAYRKAVADKIGRSSVL